MEVPLVRPEQPFLGWMTGNVVLYLVKALCVWEGHMDLIKGPFVTVSCLHEHWETEELQNLFLRFCCTCPLVSLFMTSPRKGLQSPESSTCPCPSCLSQLQEEETWEELGDCGPNFLSFVVGKTLTGRDHQFFYPSWKSGVCWGALSVFPSSLQLKKEKEKSGCLGRDLRIT